MKMTSSLVVFLQALFMICFASLVASQSSSSARPPTSQAAGRCPALDDPANGTVSVTLDTATYSCIEGFTLMGEATRTCVEGNWGGEAPTCQQNPTPAPASTNQSSPSSGGAAATSMTPRAEPEPEPTGRPATTDDDENDTDNEQGDMDANSQDGDNDNDKGNGGLRGDQIALAILATLLSVATIAFFAGLIYWKFKGTSYVTVSADTTYLK